MHPYFANIEKETVANENYRRVLFTGEKMQLVVMNLAPGEDIPFETHPDIDQFIRVEAGEASVEVEGENFRLNEDDVIIIPAGSEHHVKNVGEGELKIYTIYATPEHPHGTIHKTKAEADAAHDEHEPGEDNERVNEDDIVDEEGYNPEHSHHGEEHEHGERDRGVNVQRVSHFHSHNHHSQGEREEHHAHDHGHSK